MSLAEAVTPGAFVGCQWYGSWRQAVDPAFQYEDFVSPLWAEFLGVCNRVALQPQSTFLAVSVDPRLEDLDPTRVADSDEEFDDEFGSRDPWTSCESNGSAGLSGFGATGGMDSSSSVEPYQFSPAGGLVDTPGPGVSTAGFLSQPTAVDSRCTAEDAQSRVVLHCLPTRKLRKVTFDFQVSFWFPSEDQLTLPRCLSDTACRVDCEPAACSIPFSPHLDSLEGVSCQGPSCPSDVQPDTFAAPPTIGVEHPVPLAPRTAGSELAIPDSCSRLTPKGAPIGFCGSVPIAGPFELDWPISPLFVASPSMSGVENPMQDLHFSVEQGPANPPAPPVDKGSPCLAVWDHFEHVGFRSSGLGCAFGGLLSFPAVATESSVRVGAPRVDWPGKAKAVVPLLAAFNAPPYQPHVVSRHPGLAVPLENAGYHRSTDCGVSTASRYTDMAVVFASFDSINGLRSLVGDRRWMSHQFIDFAISTARLPGAPHGRIAAFEASALPSPQVIITQSDPDLTLRAVNFDLRNLGFDIESLEVALGQSVQSAILHLRQLPAEHDLHVRLRTGFCCCMVNGVQQELQAPLPGDADLVQFLLIARPFCRGDPRPPVPAIPQFLPQTPSASQPLDLADRAISDAQQALAPLLSVIVPLDEGEQRFSVLGTIEGVVNRPRPLDWTDNQCLLDALAHAAAPGPFLDGRVIARPLIGLFTPQILLLRASPSSGLVTVACDLRALRLGVSVLEFRSGTPVSNIVSVGSVLFGELAHLGREHLTFNFLVNGQTASPDVPILAPTETVTLLPVEVSRTASASTAAASRWRRAAEAAFSGDLPLQFTVFDRVHHFRVLPRQAPESDDVLIARARDATPELPHATGFPLEHIVPGLPLPQFVLLSGVAHSLVVPVVYSFQPLSVCTVEVPSDASAFQIAYQCSTACHALRTAHNQVARGTAVIASRQGTIAQFRTGCVLGHEAVTLRGFQPGACRPRRHTSVPQSGMPTWLEARPFSDGSNLEDLHLHEVMIFCPRRAPVRMSLAAELSHVACRHRIQQANRYGSSSSVVWPFFRPALPDARPLVLVVPPEALEESGVWGILDLRRVVHPPFRTLQTLPLPSVLDLGVLLDVLRAEMPSLPPLQHVYVGGDLLDDTPRTVHNGALITLASTSHTLQRPRVPVIDNNVDLLERRPGYRAWYNTFEPRDPRGRYAHGASSSSSSISEDHTDSSASFHSDWVDALDPPFEPFPLQGPCPTLGLSSTSTTTTVDFANPAVGVDPPVEARSFPLRIFFAARGMPVGTLSLSNQADLHVVFARTLHYALQHVPMAFRPCIRFNPRVYPWRSEDNVIFGTVRGDTSGSALIWVVDRLSEARPRVLELAGEITFHDLVSQAGFRGGRNAAAVNGDPWDGGARLFRDGDVVFMSSYEAMRGELRWKFHLRSWSLDCRRTCIRHAALLAFPVLGPLLVPLVTPGQRLSPAEQHAHVTLPSLLNYFRGAVAGLRATYLQQGSHGLIFVGPGIPAFRLGVSLEPPMPLDSVAVFYRDFLEPFYGRRDIYCTRVHISDASVFAALPPASGGCTWIAPVGRGVDIFPGDAEGDEIQAREVLDGMSYAPRILFGRIGVCWLRFLADLGRGAAAETVPPPSHTTLGSVVRRHSLSIPESAPLRCVLEGPACVPTLVPEADPPDEPLLAAPPLGHIAAGTPPRERSRSPVGVPGPALHSASDTAATQLLQLQARFRKVEHLPPPAPAAVVATDGPPPRRERLTLKVCTHLDHVRLLQIPAAASVDDVRAVAAEEGLGGSEVGFVPLHPPWPAQIDLLLQAPSAGLCAVLLRHHITGSFRRVLVSEGISGPQACVDLGLGSCTLAYCGRPVQSLPFLFGGMILDVVPHRQWARPFRLALHASISCTEGQLACIGAACKVLEDVSVGMYLDLCQDWTRLTLSPAIWSELSCCGPPIDLSLLKAGDVVHIYTDGSQSLAGAGWGFVAFCWSPTGGWSRQGFAGASSIGGHFNQSHHDSCEAEACAIVGALTWALRLPDFIPVHVGYDCEGAAQSTIGQWALPLQKDGTFRFCHVLARSLYLLHGARGRRVSFHHIHSHTGCVWNDIADAIAGQAAVRRLPDIAWPEAVREQYSQRLVRWWWMLPASPIDSGLPAVSDLIARTADKEVQISLPSPARACRSRSVATTIALRCATFNVCTFATDAKDKGPGLYVPSIQSLLQSQCHAQGLDVVGLQETRLPSSCRHVSEHYLVFNAACVDGAFGCSLWLAREQTTGNPDHSPLQLSQCTVLVSEPRMLFVRVKAPARSWLCIVAHAPHSRRPSDERDAWWESLERAFVRTVQPEDLVILCIDANARVGKPCCDRIGSHQADPVTPNGVALTHFLQLADLYLPSTTVAHSGSSVTWVAPAGGHARMDFVAIPSALRAGVTRSWVWDTPDVLQRRPDHFAPVVEFAYTRAYTLESKQVSRLAVDPACVQAWNEAVAAVPPVPWSLSVDAHEAALTKALHHRARPYKAHRSRRPSRPFVGPAILEALQLRRHLKGNLQRATARQNSLILGILFGLWRTAVRLDLCRDTFSNTSSLPRSTCELGQLDFCLALDLRAYQQVAILVRKLLKAAKAAYMEELGMTLTRAAENHDAAQAYQALRALVPAVRKKSSVAPAVPLLAKDGHAFADGCDLAQGWMRHFGDIEGGVATTWDSLGAVHLGRCRRAKQGQAPGLAELPDRLQWEHSFRKVKKGKAPGLDGLDHDSLALALPPVTGLSFPLTLKVATCRTEPLRWRGGEALPLFKGKGSGQRLDQYRSILLESSFAKRWHAWLRSSLIPTFLSVRAPLQSGACRGVSTGALSLLARSFQHICRGRRLSHAMLFVDLRAAFYSVVREFLCSKPPEELDWPTLAQALHLSESQQAYVAALLADGGDATIKSVQPHLLSYLEDLLAGTWFQVRGSSIPVHTRKGTRPGDPLADLLFSFTIAAPLKQLAADMEQQGLRVRLSCAGILPSVPVGDALAPATASWHDDVVVFLAVEKASDLLTSCSFVARRVHDLFLERGLRVNYDGGKSEAVCTPLGSGSKPVLRRLRHPAGATIFFLPDHDPMQALTCTDSYRHLGSMLHDAGCLLVEVRRRLQQARIALQPLRKPIFARVDLSQAAKHNFLRSYVLSRLLLNVGSWFGLQVQDQFAWQAGVLAIYKCMLPRPRACPDAHVTSAALCQHARCPPPLALIRIERMRLAFQLAREVEAALLAVLEAGVGCEAGWLEALMADVSWARRRLPTSAWEGLPADPTVARFFAWCQTRPGSWATVLQRLWVEVASRPEPEDFLSRQAIDAHQRTCPLCQATCKGKQGLAAHLSRKHDLHSYTRRLIRGTRCSACGLQLHTRTRLLCHVQKRSPRCRAFLLRHCKPVSVQECEAADEAERLRKKASKEMGRLDRAPAVQEPVPCLVLEDSASELGSEDRVYDDILAS